MENSKLINQINQLFHNKGVKQEERFNLLMTLLEKKSWPKKSLARTSNIPTRNLF